MMSGFSFVGLGVGFEASLNIRGFRKGFAKLPRVLV